MADGHAKRPEDMTPPERAAMEAFLAEGIEREIAARVAESSKAPATPSAG